MWEEMMQFGGNSVFVIDPDEVVKARLEPLTLETLCTSSPSKSSCETDIKKKTLGIKKAPLSKH